MPLKHTIAGGTTIILFALASLGTGWADPPPWAPAHGWRAKHRYEERVFVVPSPPPVIVVPVPAPVLVAPPPVVVAPVPVYSEPSVNIIFPIHVH